jgi:hypothetical protein
MTKAALCVACTDIVSPRRAWETDRRWRWCECDETGARWRDGTKGLLEVTSLRGSAGVRVIGINNLFLQAAVSLNPHSPDGVKGWSRITCSTKIGEAAGRWWSGSAKAAM